MRIQVSRTAQTGTVRSCVRARGCAGGRVGASERQSRYAGRPLAALAAQRVHIGIDFLWPGIVTMSTSCTIVLSHPRQIGLFDLTYGSLQWT